MTQFTKNYAIIYLLHQSFLLIFYLVRNEDRGAREGEKERERWRRERGRWEEGGREG